MNRKINKNKYMFFSADGKGDSNPQSKESMAVCKRQMKGNSIKMQKPINSTGHSFTSQAYLNHCNHSTYTVNTSRENKSAYTVQIQYVLQGNTDLGWIKNKKEEITEKETFIHAVHLGLLLYFNCRTYNDKERKTSWNARHKN
jgi:hypothetical protein